MRTTWELWELMADGWVFRVGGTWRYCAVVAASMRAAGCAVEVRPSDTPRRGGEGG